MVVLAEILTGNEFGRSFAITMGMIELSQRLVDLIDAVLLALGITWTAASAVPMLQTVVARVRRRS